MYHEQDIYQIDKSATFINMSHEFGGVGFSKGRERHHPHHAIHRNPGVPGGVVRLRIPSRSPTRDSFLQQLDYTGNAIWTIFQEFLSKIPTKKSTSDSARNLIAQLFQKCHLDFLQGLLVKEVLSGNFTLDAFCRFLQNPL